MRKLIYTAVVLAVLLLVGWQVWRRLGEEAGPAGSRAGVAAVAVEIEPLERKTIVDVRQFAGSLSPNYRFVIAPKVAGRLQRLLVDIGDRVERGQVIALLDDAEFAQHLEQARASLRVANAQLEESQSTLDTVRREYERAQSLFDRNITSESELEAKEVAYQVAQSKANVALANVTQAEAALRGAEIRLEYSRIRAEWDTGEADRIVGEKFVDEGTMLRANDPICSVLDIDKVKAVIHVIERDYPRIREGQAAMIETDAWPGETFAGTVARVAPELREASRQARVEIAIENEDWLLKPGMFIRAGIELARNEDALVAPASAIVRRNGQTGVFLVDREEMKARFVPVSTGIANRNHTEILEPALTGSVVVLGQHLLGDEGRISLPGSDGAPAPRQEGQGGER